MAHMFSALQMPCWQEKVGDRKKWHTDKYQNP